MRKLSLSLLLLLVVPALHAQVPRKEVACPPGSVPVPFAVGYDQGTGGVVENLCIDRTGRLNPSPGVGVAMKPLASDAIQYVSPNGNDSNDGLSWGTAKRTIGAARLAVKANGGGTIYVASGSYTESPFPVDGYAPIHLVCAGWSSVITFNGTAVAIPVFGGDIIENCHFIGPNNPSIISGVFSVWAPNTSFPAGTATVPTPIHGNGHYYIPNSSCTTGSTEPTWPTSSGGTVSDGTCTWVETGPTQVIIRNNLFEGTTNSVINTGPFNYGWIIVGNTFRNTGGEGILMPQGTQRTTVAYNYAYNLAHNFFDSNGMYNRAIGNIVDTVTNTSAHNHCFLSWTGGGYTTSYNVFSDNLCINPAGTGVNISTTPGQVSNQNIITNNIFVGGQAGVDVGTGAAGESDYNIIEGNQIYNSNYAIALDINNGTVMRGTIVANNKMFGSVYADLVFSGWTNSTTITGSKIYGNSYSLTNPFLGSEPDVALNIYGKIQTDQNCASSASPAACGNAAAGSFVIPAGATSVVVNTTAVTANSQIFVIEDQSLGSRLGVTCNTTITSPPVVSARTPGTSFTVTISAAVTTNPACYSYFIVN